jgi:gamma-glutamylcyclotransferase (GGCT)/AIG2-like uncharacterized protein YtfP
VTDQIKIFLYGTLRHPEVFERVTQWGVKASVLEKSPLCFLEGHQAFYVQDEIYPGLKESPGERVEGQLLLMPKDLLPKLISYEGPDDYLFLEKEFTLGNQKEQIKANLFYNTSQLVLSDRVWSYSSFQNEGGVSKVLSKIEDWMR